MLSRTDVQSLIEEEGLADHAELILGAVRPGYRLRHDPGADVSRPGVTKIGGLPDLAAGEEWPHSQRGRMVLLAQIDLDALEPVSAQWPDPDRRMTSGLLRVFADIIQPWDEPTTARLLLAESGSEWTRTTAPEIDPDDPVYAEIEEIERLLELPESPVRPEPFLTLPPGLLGNPWLEHEEPSPRNATRR